MEGERRKCGWIHGATVLLITTDEAWNACVLVVASTQDRREVVDVPDNRWEEIDAVQVQRRCVSNTKAREHRWVDAGPTNQDPSRRIRSILVTIRPTLVKPFQEAARFLSGNVRAWLETGHVQSRSSCVLCS
mmetsp:Transcript_10805/g.66733  ORF Transcript_10805/g.66733 Transcript_10805/m.66733 type:complete len:132 (+) Transcript_10805:209-604(+)